MTTWKKVVVNWKTEASWPQKIGPQLEGTFPETIRKGLDFGGFVKNMVGGSTVLFITQTHKRRAQNGKELDRRREISTVQADT